MRASISAHVTGQRHLFLKVKKTPSFVFISLDHIYHKRISQIKLKFNVRILHVSTEMFYFSFQRMNDI